MMVGSFSKLEHCLLNVTIVNRPRRATFLGLRSLHRRLPVRPFRESDMPDTNRNERTTGSMYRTWGLGRRAEPLEIYDPNKFKFIARVLDHLGLRLIDVRGDGEPAQI